MDKSAIILAGGFSSRLGQDKGLLHFAGKPLIMYVLNAVDKIVDEKIVVVSSRNQAESYMKVLESSIKVLVDDTRTAKAQSPLIGASTGFKGACGRYALLLPCDTPLISRNIQSFLLEVCTNRNAAIPRWPNGYIEPLQAAYNVKPALDAAESALGEGKFNMQSMVDKLHGVRYVSTLVLQQLDPELTTFFNINTPLDLKKAENMLKLMGKRKLH